MGKWRPMIKLLIAKSVNKVRILKVHRKYFTIFIIIITLLFLFYPRKIVNISQLLFVIFSKQTALRVVLYKENV